MADDLGVFADDRTVEHQTAPTAPYMDLPQGPGIYQLLAWKLSSSPTEEEAFVEGCVPHGMRTERIYADHL